MNNEGHGWNPRPPKFPQTALRSLWGNARREEVSTV
jgi:hypothetical protein